MELPQSVIPYQNEGNGHVIFINSNSRFIHTSQFGIWTSLFIYLFLPLNILLYPYFYFSSPLQLYPPTSIAQDQSWVTFSPPKAPKTLCI